MLKFGKMWLSNGLKRESNEGLAGTLGLSPQTSEDKAGHREGAVSLSLSGGGEEGRVVIGQPSIASRYPSSVEVVVFAWPRGSCRLLSLPLGSSYPRTFSDSSVIGRRWWLF